MLEDTTQSSTRVAVIGTLAEFHNEPIPYDLTSLVNLVTGLRPDLLCLDLTPLQWQRRDFGDLPPEYREALLPLANQTDIVVAPIGDRHSSDEPQTPIWRRKSIDWLRNALAILQRTAPGPDAINHGIRHELANLLYFMIAWLTGMEVFREQDAHADHLTRAVVEVARRDPGTRVLVVVNVQFCHRVRPALRNYPEIQVVRYSEL
jgi:hypothetical protein